MSKPPHVVTGDLEAPADTQQAKSTDIAAAPSSRVVVSKVALVIIMTK